MFRDIIKKIMEVNEIGPLDLVKNAGLKEPDDKSLIMYLNKKRSTFPLSKMEKIFDKFVDFKVKK